jgi:hypothetical protein
VSSPATEREAPPARPGPALVSTWPHLIFREVIAALICLALFFALSIVADAPLEAPANPADTPNPARAPWYFVGLQELLVYFDPWMAGVAIPLIIVLGLCAIPYIDPSTRGGGVYSRAERPLAFFVFTAGLAGWFILIAIGSWFRGPAWSWQWPGGAAVARGSEAAGSLPNALGIPLVVLGTLGGGAALMRMTRQWEHFSRSRRLAFVCLSLAMTGVTLKILLRIVFGVKYVVSLPGIGFNL